VNNLVSGTPAANQYGLITQERAEKFDLLGQLVLNQQESIILCGSEGVGKTTLLNNFKKQKENSWIVCLFYGLDTLSFEQIQIQLSCTIKQHFPELKNHDLQTALDFCAQQQQKVVLLIDDAIHLTAQLISTLIEYALQNSAVRIVFALTREQLYRKNKTDRVLEDCYFMEIPPLTQAQIADFLPVLPEYSHAGEYWKTDEKLLGRLYRCTGGVPGKIAAQLALIVESKQKKTVNPILKAALIISVMALSIYYFFEHKITYKAYFPPSQFLSRFLPLKPIKNLVKPVAKQNSQAVVLPNVKPVLTTQKTVPANKQMIQQDADKQWIMEQAPEKYSLQLMAFSKRQSLESIVKKHQSLQSNLKIVQIESPRQESYILLYGSFSDLEAAYAAVKVFPSEFKKAWPRQFKSLQQEVKK
jgi:type II secretory pathway predicted ATPase ExeA